MKETSLEKYKKEVAYFMRRLYKKNLTTSSGGNISYKYDDSTVIITPSELDKARLKRRDNDLYRSVDPRTWSKNWVAHSLHYGQGKSVVLNYLARYVFRIAITNNRIISMDQRHVTIRYKDRKAGRWITSRLEGSEFIRRYLQHVLPKGFHKVRYYGIWHKSNAHHVSTLANSMTLAAIMSGQPIRQSENEYPPIVEPS